MTNRLRNFHPCKGFASSTTCLKLPAEPKSFYFRIYTLSFETENSLKRYQRFLNRIPLSDTNLCIKALKIKILNYSLKNPNTLWSRHVNSFHLKKYQTRNPEIYTTLENWFNSSEFSKDLESFSNQNLIDRDPLIKSVIFNPDSYKPKPKSTTSVDSGLKKTSERRKLDYLKKYTSDPENYQNLSWKKIYRIFPCKVLVSDTQQCFEIFKARICNRILKDPSLKNWTRIEKKVNLDELKFENSELVSKVKKWYLSDQFSDDYQKFIFHYPIPNCHPKLDLKIGKKPPKINFKIELENLKRFIFESLLNLKEKNQTRTVLVNDFLSTNSFIEFATKNQCSKSSLKQIKKWYYSDTFSKDLERFQQNSFVSQPSKQQIGLERYKQFVKPENDTVLDHKQSIEWLEPIQEDLSSILKNDLKSEEQFYDWFNHHKGEIRKLTEQEIESEKELFSKISTQEEMLDWLNNSKSLSNQLLGMWKSQCLGDSKIALLVSEDHHIMPIYMEKYGISIIKIESEWNLISLTPAMHNLIHAIRFLEYEFYEDYRVIHKIHNALKGKELIKTNNRETVFKILENIQDFNAALRKAKFINLDQDLQEMFANDMIWQGICDYQIKTTRIPGGTVASFQELIVLLHSRFKPDQEIIIPTGIQVNNMRRYLNGFCPHLSKFAWQLVNLNKKMLQSVNQKNRSQTTLQKYHRYTVWEYQSEKTHRLVFPPINTQVNFIKLLEDYQQHDFSQAEKQLLSKLLWSKNLFNGPVSKWKLVSIHSDLSTL